MTPAGDPVPDAEAINDLVRRAQKGEARAFDALVSHYRDRVYSMIYQMVRNEHDARDIAQEAFVKAWKSLGRFHWRSSFYTWLYRIVMNVSIDWMRRRKNRPLSGLREDLETPESDISEGMLAGASETPSAALEARELRERIDGAIATLSPDHRAVILLKEVEGLHYREIAEVVGCSVGTVMSRIFYARKKLQELLEDVYEPSN